MTEVANPAPTRPPQSADTPPGFHLLAKPSGSTCNIDCTYCFFLSKESLYPSDRHRMSQATLETYIRQFGLYSVIEKAFMVWLVLFNVRQPFVAGFWLPFAKDLTVVVYTIGYFAYCGIERPLREEPNRTG